MSLIIIRMLHIYTNRWYKAEEIRRQVIGYYSKTRNITHKTKHKYRELIRCCDCGMYFITTPSNRGRTDIRCPFGCREKHKKEVSRQRVNRYRKTEKGKERKKEANKNRYLLSRKEQKREKNKKQIEEDQKGSFIGYLRFILSLIEGRYISWQKIKSILLGYFKKWRQHPLEYWLSLCNMTL